MNDSFATMSQYVKPFYQEAVENNDFFVCEFTCVLFDWMLTLFIMPSRSVKSTHISPGQEVIILYQAILHREQLILN